MTINATLRPATANDLPEILAIVNHAIAHTTANYDYEPHSMEVQQAWFDEKATSGFPIIVAEYENKAVGFATYGTFRQKFGYRFTVEHSVYVTDKLTGKGIGRKLLAALIEKAKSGKYHMMIGVIDKANTDSIAFHQQFGFTETGVIKEVAFKFGQWLDVSIMQLKLE
jgi:L-amino acid N-acyltransferase YncA